MNGMTQHISKSHNRTLLIYHLVCPVKYRRKVFTEEVSHSLKEICLEFGPAYEIHFLEIGIDEDHVHFLIQITPNNTLSNIVTKIKSITAKYIFTQHKEVKTFLWGGKFWSSGYYANTVGQHGNIAMITNYIKNQGIKSYQQLHSGQLMLFK